MFTADEMKRPGPRAQALFFALYILLLAIGFVVGPVIWRETLYYIFYIFTDFGWWRRFLYMFFVVAGTFLLVGGVLAAEPYLQRGARDGGIVRRFLKVAVPLVVFGIVGWVMQAIGSAMVAP